jgi:hypothetical protein
MSRAFLATALLLAAASGVAAGPPVPPVRLTIRPAALPDPVLRYPLVPGVAEEVAGNAAPHYARATARLKKLVAADEGAVAWYQTVEEWTKVPLVEMPRDEVRDFLKRHREVLEEVDAAVRCDHCDWGHSERIRKDGIAAPIPEIQHIREMINLVGLRTRLAVADGDVAEATRGLRAGYAMARHATASPALVSGLVGVAMATLTTQRLEELLQQPGTPNLYWSLADLPRPLVDVRRGLDGERMMVHATFAALAPSLADPDAGPLGPEPLRGLNRWLAAFDRGRGLASELVRVVEKGSGVPLPQVDRFATEREVAADVLCKHEAAKAALVAAGRPRGRVEAMPHLQVAFLHAVLDYDRQLDEVRGWHALPYWEAVPRLRAIERRAKDAAAADSPALPLARDLLPAMGKVVFAGVRVDRRLAALRVVEALRLYAASHGGKLPASLDDIKEVPVPADPATGKQFAYAARGDTATLSGPTAEGIAAVEGNVLSYEITMKR